MKVGIIGAMDEEITYLKSKLLNLEENNIANYIYFTGQINNIHIILFKSGIGKVNAAIGTTLLIDRFSPNYIINTGSAGAFSEELNIGDVVIPSEIRHHDVDTTIFGYEYGQIPGMPAAFSPDSKLLSITETALKRINSNAATDKVLGTGDSFMDTNISPKNFDKFLPKIDAVEMEAAAIAQTCYQLNIPFVIIRSISDAPGKEAKETFKKYLETASKNSATMVLEIINELAKYEIN